MHAGPPSSRQFEIQTWKPASSRPSRLARCSRGFRCLQTRGMQFWPDVDWIQATCQVLGRYGHPAVHVGILIGAFAAGT